jgi:hypothetical protein
VIGLGKYAVPPPGSCKGLAIAGTSHCLPCDDDPDCGGEPFACVDLLDQGGRCFQACEATSDCPSGYTCALQEGGTRCIPHPGEVWARCGIAPASLFVLDFFTPPGGWVKPGETFEVPSGRLGEVAIVCLGGWKDPGGVFTPTVLGVRRHVFADSGAVVDGLDVTLDHPLDTTFRLRLQDPPAWPDGLQPPYVIVSLDLGPDGVIPFSRTLVPDVDSDGDPLWLAPRQLGALTGGLYDAKYFFYTSLSAVSDTGYPTTYNLLTDVPFVGEPRLPVYEEGSWTLEPTLNDRDLFALWGTSSDHVLAVGAGGRVLLRTSGGWTAQSVPTARDLRAVTGRGPGDVWVAGDDGALLHSDGLSWLLVTAPEEDLRAAATAPGEPLFVAGPVRVRRMKGDGSFVADGPPWVQDVHALHMASDGRLAAAGSEGRVLLRDEGGSWTSLETPTEATLRAVHLDAATGEVVAAGDEGTLLVGKVPPGSPAAVLAQVPLPPEVREDLFAVARTPSGDLHVAGDYGRVLHREGGVWEVDEVPEWRSRARAVFAAPDSGPIRFAGDTTFVLGPILHFPILKGVLPADPSTPADFAPGLTIGYTWAGGPAAQFSQVTIYEELGPEVWAAIVDGKDEALTLPDLEALAGHPGHGHGPHRVDVLRVLNPDFDIDLYSTRDFSIFKRKSWTTGSGVVVFP